MINPLPVGAVYQQLAERLRADIIAGRIPPGGLLPSESRLSQEHGVARQTARKAVAVLRAEGLVVVRRGHGVIVRDEPVAQDVTPAPGSTVVARMPTIQERTDRGVPEGVPVFEVTSSDGSVEVFPADRWRLRWPA